MAKSIFPAFLTAEISPETSRNLARFEQMHATSYARIANAANRAGQAGARQALTPSSAGLAATRAAAAAQESAARASGRLARESITTSRALGQQNRALYQTSASARAAADGLHRTAASLQVIQGPLGPMAGRLTAVSNAFRVMSGAALAFTGAGAGVVGGLALASKYADIKSQLSPLFESQQDLNRALGDTARIAVAARQGLQPIADLYAKLTVVGREYNWEQERVARLTQTIAKAARLSGGSAQSQEAGITQLAQGLGSGVLQGDELRSVRENTLRLARAIAGGLGVSISDLKKLGEQGVLTSEVVAGAIERSADRIERETGRMQMTLSAGLTTAGTNATVFFGQLDQALGITQALGAALVALSSNLDTIATVAAAAAAAGIGVMVRNFTRGLAASKALGAGLRAMTADAAAAAQAELAAAQKTVAALNTQSAAIQRNIALLEARRVALKQGAVEGQFAQSIAMPRTGPTRADLDGNTAALNSTRTQLLFTNQRLAVSEAALAAAQTNAAAATARIAAPASLASRALGGLKSIGAGLVSFLGGPWGIAFGAATAAVIYFSSQMSDLEKATAGAERALEQYGRLVDTTTGKLVDMSEQQRKALLETSKLTLDAATQDARRVQGAVAGQLGASLRGWNVSPTEERARIKQYEDRFAAIRKGGKDAAEVYARFTEEAAKGDKIAIEFLERTKDLRAESTKIASIQQSARSKYNLATGGTDAKFAEREAQSAAEAATQRERGAAALARMAKDQNTLDDNSRYVKNLETAYEQLTGIADLTEKIASQQTLIADLSSRPIPKGAEGDRRNALKAANKELQDLQKLQADAAPQADKWARELTKAQTAQRDYNRKVRDQKSASSEAESAEKKRLRTLEQIEDKQRQVADILGKYAGDPKSVTTALEQIRRLKDLEGDLLADGTRFSAGDMAAQSAAIVAGMRRDIELGLIDKERELELDRMILAGREREAAMLAAKWEFQREFGTMAQLEARAAEEAAAGREREAAALRARAKILPEYEARTTAAAAAAVDQARAKESAQRLISIYEQVPRSLQQGFESVFENIHRRGIKSAKDLFNVFRDTFRRFQAQLIGEYLFGGLDRQIGDLARGQIGGTGTPSRTPQPWGHRDSSAGWLSQAAGFLGLGGSSSNKELIGVTEENSEKLEALGATLTRSISTEQRSTARLVGSIGAAASTILAGGQAVATAAGAVASAAAGQAAGTAGAPQGVVDTFNAIGKVLGGKLDKVFGTGAKEAGKSGMFQGLGAKAGTAMAAYTLADTFTSVLGIKGVAGGAIKGAATGAALAGPWGAVAGAVIGGLSSAFKKTAKSSATISSSGGSFGDATITGTSSKRKAAAGSLGNALEDAISGVVDQLDATLGDVQLSIGTRKKKFVLDPSGRGRTKGSGVQKFDTEEEAIEAGLRLALQRGVVKGISAASQRILQSGQDLEDAIEKASLIESVPKRLMQLTDPARYAVEELNKQFGKLIDALIEGAATAEQIADAEKLYGLERAAAVEAAQQAVSDSIDRFLSDIRAGSASPLGAKATYANADKELEGFRTDIAAGKAVDDDKLVEALQTFYDASRALNGSRAAFFEDYADIQSLAEKARAINRNAVDTAPDTSTLPASPFESGDRAAKIDAYLQRQNQISTAGNDILAGLPDAIADRLAALLGGRGGGNTAFNYLPGLGGLGFAW